MSITDLSRQSAFIGRWSLCFLSRRRALPFESRTVGPRVVHPQEGPVLPGIGSGMGPGVVREQQDGHLRLCHEKVVVHPLQGLQCLHPGVTEGAGQTADRLTEHSEPEEGFVRPNPQGR